MLRLVSSYGMPSSLPRQDHRRGSRVIPLLRAAGIRFVCSDMWKAFLKVVKKKAPGAIHILDRFHIMALLNKAIDKIRAGEAKRLKSDGYEPVLKHSRWCWLKRVWNLTKNQTTPAACDARNASRLTVCVTEHAGPAPRALCGIVMNSMSTSKNTQNGICRAALR